METNEIKEKNGGKRTHRLAVVIGLAILLYGVFAIYQALQPQKEKPRIVLEPGQKAGERKVVTISGVEFAFRWCPAGWFLMGSSNEKGREPDEEQYYVMLTKGFWMMETEVTQKQWKAVMERNPSHFKGDDLPVENVDWQQCHGFCRETGLHLPTESQWEYACRAGTKEAYAGNLDDMAWYDEEWDKGSAHPVGTKKPNAWGLYDMHGNVNEWCNDIYGAYPRRRATDPTGVGWSFAPVDYRVVRGGSWDDDASFCRSASRSSREEKFSWGDIGFRCVIVP